MRLRIVDLRTLDGDSNPDNINFIELLAPEDIVTADHILGGVRWTTDDEVAVHWLNRRQNETVLRICNIAAGINCIVSILKLPLMSK